MLWLMNVTVVMMIAKVLHLFCWHCWFPGGSLGGVLISARKSPRFVGLLYGRGRDGCFHMIRGCLYKMVSSIYIFQFWKVGMISND